MGNSLRCCLACVLPCGALDLIRIVHLNGIIEEMHCKITAGQFLKNYPNHVLTKPCSQEAARWILILSPESELKRGSIYFLIPVSSLPAEKNAKILKKLRAASTKKTPEIHVGVSKKKKPAPRRLDRSKNSCAVWRPDLECITED